MKEGLPPWNPRPGAETEWFIEWTITEWKDLWGLQTNEDAWRDADSVSGEMISRSLMPDFPLLRVLTTKDEEAFVRLMQNPEQARYAFRYMQDPEWERYKVELLFPHLKVKPQRGRPKKPIDHDAHYLDWPSEIVDQIEQYVWKRHYRKFQRHTDNTPTVYQIVAEILRREGLKKIDADKIEAHRRRVGKSKTFHSK